MQKLQVHLFGRFRAQRARHTLPGLDARKVQELLCYLLLNREVPHSREYLAGLFWRRGTTKQQRTYLRKTLWQLQEALGADASAGEEAIVQVEPDWVQLRLREHVWLDVAALEQTYAGVSSIPGSALQDAQAQAVREAVELYAGDLLEGWYQDWCLCERERLQYKYLALLDKLLDHCDARHRFDEGVRHGFRILQHDRAHERTHRKMMRLFFRAGDRTGALRQYERCRAALAEELEVEPSSATKDLHRRIQDDALGALTTEGAPRAETTNDTLRAARQRLEQLRNFLVDLDANLKREIMTIDDDLGA